MKKTLFTLCILTVLNTVPLKGGVTDKTYFQHVIPEAATIPCVLPALGGGLLISLALSRVETKYSHVLYNEPFLPDYLSHTCDRYISEFWFVPISLAGAVLEGYQKDQYYEPIRYMVTAHSINLGLTYALKWGIGRIRPDETPLSFPSGHTSIAFTTATLWANWHGSQAGIPMYSLAVLTALSRINDKRHWPADVFFGAILGTVTARALYLAEKNEKENAFSLPEISLLEIRFSSADWNR